MSDHILKNNELTIKVNSLGAELIAITDHNSNKDYLWYGDAKFWKRHSPILFPIVGSLNNQTYVYNGKEYHLPQHGFARDTEFTVVSESDTEIWFRIQANEETLKVYPFLFALEIGYRLTGRSIEVLWRVSNKGDSEMYFSIGGHPAFMLPLNENHDQKDYYIGFDNANPVRYLSINEKGLAVNKPMEEQSVLPTDNGFLKYDPHLFDNDALIIEHNQFHAVSLADPDKKPYVTLRFDAPLFGLWTPSGKDAPFVCIEPWYGRCDSSVSNGNLEDKDWINHIGAGKVFEASYTIDIG
jgi:galactose mutarotase-like enzyme